MKHKCPHYWTFEDRGKKYPFKDRKKYSYCNLEGDEPYSYRDTECERGDITTCKLKSDPRVQATMKEMYQKFKRHKHEIESDLECLAKELFTNDKRKEK